MTRALRVLLLCEPLNTAGGVERFVCALASHLAGEGMEVAIGSVSARRDEIRYPLHSGVRVLVGAPAAATIDTGTGSKLQRAWGIARTQWRIGGSLGRLIRSERPVVIVVNGLTSACSVLALNRGVASRTICCDHNHFGARSRPWQRLRAWLYPKVAAVVSLTEADENGNCLRRSCPSRPRHADHGRARLGRRRSRRSPARPDS